MLSRFWFFPIFVFLVVYFSFVDWAWANPHPQQRDLFESRVRQYLVQYQVTSSPGEWAKDSPGLTRAERRTLLQEKRFLEQKLPPLRLQKRDGRLFILSPNLEVELTHGSKRELIVNGVKVRWDQRTSLFELAHQISLAGESRKSSLLSQFGFSIIPRLFQSASATELTATEACSGKWEFYFRSPHRLFDNTVVWFVPPLTIAGAVLYGGSGVVNTLRNCSRHVRDLRKIMSEGRIGLKSVDCGNQGDGRDVSMEFWTAEMNHDGTQRTRTFNADFTQAILEETPLDLPEETNPIRAQQRPRTARNMYVFSPFNSQLQEVRTLTDDGDSRSCHSTKPGALTFGILRSDIDPYRRFFDYLGNNESCQACAQELNLHLVSSRPPRPLTENAQRLPRPLTQEDLRDARPLPRPATGNSATPLSGSQQGQERNPTVATPPEAQPNRTAFEEEDEDDDETPTVAPAR